MNWPTITVHAGKHYETLIDSGGAISLLRYSNFPLISQPYMPRTQLPFPPNVHYKSGKLTKASVYPCKLPQMCGY